MTKPTFVEKVLEELSKISATLADFERKEAMVQADVKQVKSDVTMQNLTMGILKSDLREAVGRLHTIEQQLADAQKELKNNGIMQEHVEEKIDQIIESINPEMEMFSMAHLRLEQHDAELKMHKLRLKALEKAA